MLKALAKPSACISGMFAKRHYMPTHQQYYIYTAVAAMVQMNGNDI